MEKGKEINPVKKTKRIPTELFKSVKKPLQIASYREQIAYDIKEMISTATPRADIILRISEYYYISEENVIKQFIDECREELRELNKISKDDLLAYHIYQYYDMFKSYKYVNGKIAIECLKRIENLLKVIDDRPAFANNNLQLQFEGSTMEDREKLRQIVLSAMRKDTNVILEKDIKMLENNMTPKERMEYEKEKNK